MFSNDPWFPTKTFETHYELSVAKTENSLNLFVALRDYFLPCSESTLDLDTFENL